MTDGISAMYDDMVAYEARCKKLGIQHKNTIYGQNSDHEEWVNLKYFNKTTQTFEEYKKEQEIASLKCKISRTEKELASLLKKLDKMAGLV